MTLPRDFYQPGDQWPALTARIVPYNNQWPKRFSVEADKIAEVLSISRDAVHHIGSSSVPGLSAKDIIDILMFYEGALDGAWRAALRNIGYVHVRAVPDPSVLFLGTVGHRIHLQITSSKNCNAQAKLAVRDFLRVYPDEARAYAVQKRNSARIANGDPGAYAKGKREFVDALEQRALCWRRLKVPDDIGK